MNTVLTETRTHKGRSKSERAHHRMKGVVSPRLAKKRRMHAGFVAGGAFSDFTYNGGPVIETPQVFALFVGDWGTGANQTRASCLQQCPEDMLNSEYMNVLTQSGCGTSGSLVNS